MTTEYTKQQRQTIAEVFKRAKQFVWDGKRGQRPRQIHEYICYAINSATTYPSEESYFHSKQGLAKSVISTRLNGYATVDGYLRHTVNVPSRMLTSRNLQTFRHLWLDSLIEEFSK